MRKINFRVLRVGNLGSIIGGISVDISVTTLAGERLCTLSGFEMTRHSNSIQQPLTRRYQLEWQPVAVPAASSRDQCHVRELSNNTRNLWMVLDCLAARTIAETLHGQIIVGVEVNSLFSFLQLFSD